VGGGACDLHKACGIQALQARPTNDNKAVPAMSACQHVLGWSRGLTGVYHGHITILLPPLTCTKLVSPQRDRTRVCSWCCCMAANPGVRPLLTFAPACR
jgi:hypothetical protein